MSRTRRSIDVMTGEETSVSYTVEEEAMANAALAAAQAILPNLEPDQFWFVVRVSGYEPDLLAWVDNMNDPGTEAEPNAAYDPVGWAAASAKLSHAKWFERDHPFIEDARVALGMSVEELDALWRFAAQ